MQREPYEKLSPATAACPVCLFIPHLAVGGSELQLLTLVRRLPAHGYEPIVVTLAAREGVPERFEELGIEVSVLPRRGWSGIDSIAALAQLVRRRRIRLIHAWLWAANWRAAIVRWLVPVPVIFSVRSLEADLRLHHSLAYRVLAAGATSILVNSEATRSRSAERTGRPDAYRIVRNGIDTAALQVSGSDIGPIRPMVGYLGSLTARKRVESLARVASIVLPRVPQARFLVVGEGDRRAALLAECDRLGVTSAFEFAGRQRDVGAWLARMTVLVHPSESEGSSNAVLEAQAVGVPVVAYRVSGNLETILHGQTGLLVSDGDELALADAVTSLLSDGERRRTMGARARTFVQEQFSIDAMVEATVAAYRSAVELAP